MDSDDEAPPTSRSSIRNPSESEAIRLAAASELDADESETFGKAVDGGGGEAKNEVAANTAAAAGAPPPDSAYYIVKKKPRGRTFGGLGGVQERILVLHKGNLRYYKSTETIVKQPPFVLSEPQGEMENGVRGCTACIALDDKEGRTLSIKASGSDKGLEVIFSGSGDLRAFLELFDSHVEYYKERPVPKLSNHGAREV